jgi:hypothetical protein
MRPLRFPSRFRWWMLAGLAILFGFPALPLAAWFAWEMPPLQRYYLLAYVDSTERAKQPGAATQVQWIFKTETHPCYQLRCGLGQQRRSTCPAVRNRHRGGLDRDRKELSNPSRFSRVEAVIVGFLLILVLISPRSR